MNWVCNYRCIWTMWNRNRCCFNFPHEPDSETPRTPLESNALQGSNLAKSERNWSKNNDDVAPQGKGAGTRSRPHRTIQTSIYLRAPGVISAHVSDILSNSRKLTDYRASADESLPFRLKSNNTNKKRWRGWPKLFISRDPVFNRGNEINMTTYYKIKNIVSVFGFGFLPRICLSQNGIVFRM